MAFNQRGRGSYGGPGTNTNLAFRGGRGGAHPGQGGGRGQTSGPSIFRDPKTGPGKADPKITADENAFIGSGKSARQAYGTLGKEFHVYGNYRQLSFTSAVTTNPPKIYVAEIDIIDPRKPKDKVPRRKRQRIVQLLLESATLSFAKNKVATDFSQLLVSSVFISQDARVQQIKYSMENEESSESNGLVYNVSLKAKTLFTISEFLHYLATPSVALNPNVPEQDLDWLQALSIVMNHDAKARSIGMNPTIMSPTSAKYFDLRAGGADVWALGQGLQARRGFFSSIRPGTNRLWLNTQVKHAAEYKPGPLTQLMDEYLRTSGHQIVLTRDNHARLEYFLKTVRIHATHLKRKSKVTGKEILPTKTIWALAQDDKRSGTNRWRLTDPRGYPSQVEFDLNEGKEPPNFRSVAWWFDHKHGMTIPDEWPVVNVGNKDKAVFLPAEVCTVLSGQPCLTQLSPSQTAAMIRHAVRRPDQNAQSIVEKSFGVLGHNSSNPVLASFGIMVAAALAKVPARLLGPPTVMFGLNQKEAPRNGQWNMLKRKHVHGATLDRWTVLCIGENPEKDPWAPMTSDGSLAVAIDEFTTSLNRDGLRAKHADLSTEERGPIFVRITPDDKIPDIHQKITEAFESETMIKRNPQLILVVLSTESKKVYNQLKIVGDINKGIHTVSVVGKKFAKPGNFPFHANVGLKVNIKLGGRNQALAIGSVPIIDEGKTMLVGLDVTHPAPGSLESAQSIVGIVASIDKHLAHYPGEVSGQVAKQEKVDNLTHLFRRRLELWQKHNGGTLPENILIYRDGVSNGQRRMVVEYELPQMKAACEALYSQKLPKFTVVVVEKRIQTRFYPMSNDQPQFVDQKSSNVAPGTVVDRAITEARNLDFFLVPHKALQGTARPSYYIVLHDEIFRENATYGGRMTTNTLQSLTHNLCYSFNRATKVISVCPPARYADLLCDRARRYKSELYEPSIASGSTQTVQLEDVHANLRDTVFYI